MDRREFLAASMVVAAGAAFPGSGVAAQGGEMTLPQPQMSGGKSFMEALKARRSERSFQSEPLPPLVLSNLLWAAFGTNRPDVGKHTAASCKNWQEIEIYAAMANGLFRYEPKGHSLTRILDKDIRALTGTQGFAATAPLNLVFVANFSKMESSLPADDRIFFAGTDTGLISQNVYLFCAAEGLATVVRASIDKAALAKEMDLSSDHWITLAQTVGYPKG